MISPRVEEKVVENDQTHQEMSTSINGLFSQNLLQILSTNQNYFTEKLLKTSCSFFSNDFSVISLSSAKSVIAAFSTFSNTGRRRLKYIGNHFAFLFCCLLFFSSVVKFAAGSESPERECCDPVKPSTERTASAPATTTRSVGKQGVNLRTSIAILNCLLARQLCFEDSSCSAILEIIPRVCGSELVACSTVTVTKCQAALRTLQAFPFFKPTCLCREPNVDPECNSFRDFLFDHPCVFVLKKEKDPYPVETLPTCTYALSVCHGEKTCANLFDKFKAACRVRDGECRMENRAQCREAWSGLRLSPLFGCICPNNHMKKRCDRIFSVINHNPCVEPSSTAEHRQPAPHHRHHPSECPPSTPPTLDLFLTRAARPRFPSLPVTRYVAPDGSSILLVTENGTRLMTRAAAAHLVRSALLAPHTPLARHEPPSPPHPTTSVYAATAEPKRASRTHPAKLISDGRKSNKTTSMSSLSTIDWIAGLDLTSDGSLIPSTNVELHVKNHISPHIMREGFRGTQDGRPEFPGGGDLESERFNPETIYGPGYVDVKMKIGAESGQGEVDMPKMSVQSSCHVALDKCIKNHECVEALTPVLQRCDDTRCDREGCMAGLRSFYRTPNVQWNLEIAFCLCKKTENKNDPCMNAQERLHPTCAQRPPEASPSPGLPACHELALSCREDSDCRVRLESYEQRCAVDSVTKGCAGPARSCRRAVLGALGTRLRAACACRAADFAQLYDCLGWQRLLWLNPCVVESQSDFHIKTYGAVQTTTPFDTGIRYIDTTAEIYTAFKNSNTTNISTTHLTTAITLTTHPRRNTTERLTSPVQIEEIPQTTAVQTSAPIVEVLSTREVSIEPTTIPTTSTTEEITTTTTFRTTTTTEPTKYCVVQRADHDDQYIKMGETRRLMHVAAESSECTEVCSCGAALQLTAACHAACVARAPCRTRLAHYAHAAPAYQAYRGRCYCYSGSFICMRPNPGEYSLPQGVYLLLGFSAQDEALLRPHTNLGVEDAARALQHYLDELARTGDLHGQTNCTLTLYNISDENVIVAAGLPQVQLDNVRNANDLLDLEKEQCIELLDTLKSRINLQHEDISTHVLLSIFKIAEVDVVYPLIPSSSRKNSSKTQTIILMLALIFCIDHLIFDIIEIINKIPKFICETYMNYTFIILEKIYKQYMTWKVGTNHFEISYLKIFEKHKDTECIDYENMMFIKNGDLYEKYFFYILCYLNDSVETIDAIIIEKRYIFENMN